MKRPNFIISAVLVAGLVLTVACSKDASRSEIKTIDTKSIAENPNLTDSEKAEELALAAERLVYSDGVVYAHTVLEQALRFDNKNTRARFYTALVKPLELQRGLRSRLNYLEVKKPGSLRNFDEDLAKSRRQKEFRDLLTQKRASDLTDENKIQAHVDLLSKSYMELRTLISSLKSSELTINLPTDVADSLGRRNKYCTVTQNGDTYNIEYTSDIYVYDYQCNFDLEKQIKLNAADFEALKQYVSGMVVLTSLPNIYAVNGALDVEKMDEKSATDVYAQLSANSFFGRLRNKSTLSNLKQLGADYSNSLRWALDKQQEICPAGQSLERSREGFLYERGICITESVANQTITDITAALNGENLIAEGPIKGQNVSVQLNALAFIDKPVTDLKTLTPKFNDCNQMTSIKDPSLNGFLPDQDGNTLLELNSRDCTR